jgi:hypothetical protein
MGNLTKKKFVEKRDYIYAITIVLLLGLTIGFLIGFIKEKNKNTSGKFFVNFFF